MSFKIWIGGAAAVAQVDTFTPANVEIGDVFTLTATGEDGSTNAVSFTATAATVANVTAGLVAAWNASTHPLATPVTAADATTAVTLTADVAGVPFYVASSATNGGAANTQTLTRAATTASQGPRDWNTVANWAGRVKPVSTDDVVLDGRGAADVLYGLDQSAVALASLAIKDAFTYAVGQVGYPLKVGATSVVIGEAGSDGTSQNGSPLVNLNLGTGATSVTVKKTRASGLRGYAAVILAAVNAANKLTVEAGSVAVGTSTPGDASTFSEVTLTASTARVELGTNVTLTTFAQVGGDAVTRSSLTTLNQDAGTIRTEGTAAITTANVAGTITANATGTIGTLKVKGAGLADFTRSTAARTVTTARVLGPSARVLANNGKPLSVTFTGGILFTEGASTTQADMGDEVTASYS